jgi:hypothetical protein
VRWRWLNAIAWIANFVGMAWGFLVLHVAIGRNSQGEYIDEHGALDSVYALQTFIPHYTVSALATALLLSILLLSVQGLFLLARWLLTRPNSR